MCGLRAYAPIRLDGCRRKSGLNNPDVESPAYRNCHNPGFPSHLPCACDRSRDLDLFGGETRVFNRGNHPIEKNLFPIELKGTGHYR